MKTTTFIILLAAICFVRFSVAGIYEEITNVQSTKISPKYFGVHFHRLIVAPTDRAVPTKWPDLQFGSLRLWDARVRWADIAPSPGVWNFDRLDFYVQAGIQNGAEILYTLGSTPRWASVRPEESCPYGFGCSAESVRIGHWEEYIRRVAERYGTHIAAYELWNEPHFSDFARDVGRPGFFTGSMQAMVEMARSARKVLDQYSPNAKLCTPGFVNGPDRLDKFLADGGAKYVQAVCYHFYSENSLHFIRQVKEVREIMHRRGVDHLPLWNTETGVETLLPTDPPSKIAAKSQGEAISRLSQMLILGAATGIERFDFYAWDNTRSGMVASDGSHQLGYEPMKRLQSWMLGAKFIGCRSKGVIISCEITNNEEKKMFIWATEPVKEFIPLPVGTRAVSVEHLFGRVEALNDQVASGRSKFLFEQEPVYVSLKPR